MTHVSCPSCRLRFTPVAAASLSTCPSCDGPLQAIVSAEQVLGFRLVTAEEGAAAAPIAVAVALPIPGPTLQR
jgi:hypothetical protein